MSNIPSQKQTIDRRRRITGTSDDGVTAEAGGDGSTPVEPCDLTESTYPPAPGALSTGAGRSDTATGMGYPISRTEQTILDGAVGARAPSGSGVLSEGAQPQADPVLSSREICSLCSRYFSSKIGLSQHYRRSHSEYWNELKLQSQGSRSGVAPAAAASGRRWTLAEKTLLARHDLRLQGLGVARGKAITVQLAQLMNRTVEAIRTRRSRDTEYLEIRKTMEESLASAENVAHTAELPEDDLRTAEYQRNLENSVIRIISELKCSSEPLIAELAHRFETARTPQGFWHIDKATINESYSRWTEQVFPAKENRQPVKPPKPNRRRRRKKRRRRVARESRHGEPSVPTREHVFASEAPGGSRGPQAPARAWETRTQRRRRLRWKAKEAFQENPYEAGRKVLAGEFGPNTEGTEAKCKPSQSDIRFWGESLERPSEPDQRCVQNTEPLFELCEPVSASEVVSCLKRSRANAPGPDGLTKKDVASVDPEIWAAWFSLWMATASRPDSLAKGLVSLIPKVAKPSDPSEYRPITVASKVSRLFHSVLATRFDTRLALPLPQRGFRSKVDGCLDNVWMIRNLVKAKSSSCESLALVFCDFKNAFGSVNHDSILVGLRKLRVPEMLVSYVKDSLDGFECAFKGDENRVKKYSVKRGVLQGDPLSSVIFNCVLADITSSLDPKFGLKVRDELPGENISATYTAYADDVVLVAESKSALSIQADNFERQARICGMILNAKKCSTLCIEKARHEKFTYVQKEPILKFGNKEVTPMTLSDTYKYLGLQIGAEGHNRTSFNEDYRLKLNTISAARIDPFHKLFTLRQLLYPKFLHTLVLGNFSRGSLRTLDKLNRNYTRAWLHLPHDTPIAAFHAAAKDGGLQIPNLEADVLRLRAWRMGNLCESIPLCRLIMSYPTALRSLESSREWPIMFGQTLCNSIDIRRLWSKRLHDSVDGQGLKSASSGHHASHRWVTAANPHISRSEYVHSIQTRLALLKTRLRASRGLAGDRKGIRQRACPQCSYRTPESLGHILQSCHMSHGLRIWRHNRICKVIAEYAHSQGWVFYREVVIPKICKSVSVRTNSQKLAAGTQPSEYNELNDSSMRWEGLSGSLKPDLILIKGTMAFVIDPTVIADADPNRPGVDVLAESDQTKVRKYDNDRVKQYIEDNFTKCPLTHFEVLGVSINWRGIVSHAAAERLTNGPLKLKPHLLTLLSVRALTGGYAIWYCRKYKATF